MNSNTCLRNILRTTAAFPIIFISVAYTGVFGSDNLMPATGNSNENELEMKTEHNIPSEFHWSKELKEGADTVFYFDEAITGKKLKQETFELLKGVDAVTIDDTKIVVHRSDNEEVTFSRDSDHGAKFFHDWQKAKTSVEDKFGSAGKEFLDSVKGIRISDGQVEVIRTGADDITVNLGQKKLHKAFDLRGLRLRHLKMTVDISGEHPMLTNIEGITAVINAPGFSFPVDLKEFGKIRREMESDFTVSVENPVPGPLRALLFLPELLHFHFSMPRKE